MNINNSSPHNFHIPVLGLSFSIDTPLKVAKFGISSVVSIIDDQLLEDMRAYHSTKNSLSYTPIPTTENDYRAKRVTAYLNMLHDLIQEQLAQIKSSSFSYDSELFMYFELLPNNSEVKKGFQ